MPQTDAIQWLGEFQAAGWKGKAILISDYLDGEWKNKAIAAGCDAVLSRPISESVLVRTVEDLLPRHAAPQGSALHRFAASSRDDEARSSEGQF